MSRIPLSDPLTLRLPVDLLADVERIAETCDRPRSWVIVRALRQYMTREGADILVVRLGREQIEGGDVHDLNDVLAEIDTIIATKVA
ncbi:MAG: CopG family ribbon-helix-helix protein [Mesorhizobium sp.]